MDSLPFSHINDKISIPCIKCDEYVEVTRLQRHREMHRAWKVLHCNADTVPKTMKQLLKKRRHIINNAMSKVDSGRSLPVKVLQKIDWAFELVRKTIPQTSTDELHSGEDFIAPNNNALLPVVRQFDSREIVNSNKDCTLNGTSEKLMYCGQSVGVCHCVNGKWRSAYEDRHLYNEDSFFDFGHGIFGLFDGYNGSVAAEKCAEYFYGFLKEELKFDSEIPNFDEMSESEEKQRNDFVKNAIKNAFSNMDLFLLTGEFESSKIRWSGASATVCYIENQTMYVANAGNVRALFVKGDGSAVSLVTDHTLKNKKERDRVRKANGSLAFSSKTSVVNGLISSTRGLGNHGDPNLKSAVISSPSITVCKINPEDQFFILYTAGISDVFDDEEVMFLLEDIMPDTSEIEKLREHLMKKGHVEDNARERSACQTETGITSRGFNENDGNQPTDVTKERGDTGNTTPDLAASDLSVDKNTAISFDQEHVEKHVSTSTGWAQDETKPCFLARALVERLVHSAILADTRENTTAMVVLLHGCPINLYLLPNVKRKSVFQREVPESDKV